MLEAILAVLSEGLLGTCAHLPAHARARPSRQRGRAADVGGGHRRGRAEEHKVADGQPQHYDHKVAHVVGHHCQHQQVGDGHVDSVQHSQHDARPRAHPRATDTSHSLVSAGNP